MQKILILVLTLITLNLVGCKFSVNSLEKAAIDVAVKEYNKNEVNYEYDCYKEGSNALVGLYKKLSNNEYQSILSGKILKTSNLEQMNTSSFIYFKDGNDVTYDCFGERLNLGSEFNNQRFEVLKTIVSGNELNSILKTDYYEEKPYVLNNYKSDSNNLYLVEGDNLINASLTGLNCFKSYLEGNFKNFYYTNDDKLIYEDDYGTKMLAEVTGEGVSSNYLVINNDKYHGKLFYSIPIKMKKKNGVIEYRISERENFSNDFNVIMDGKKFLLTVDFCYYKKGELYYDSLKGDFNYYPLQHLVSQDKKIAYVLCRKISSEGELSNYYYTLKIDDYKQSNLVKDLSLFEKIIYKYDYQVHTISLFEELIYLDEDYEIIHNKQMDKYHYSSRKDYEILDDVKAISPKVNNDFAFKINDDLVFMNEGNHLKIVDVVINDLHDLIFYQKNDYDGDILYVFKKKVAQSKDLNYRGYADYYYQDLHYRNVDYLLDGYTFNILLKYL